MVPVKLEGSGKDQCRRVTLPAGVQSRALRDKVVTSQLVEERFCHLTARAVVDANKEDTFLHFLLRCLMRQKVNN